MKLDKSILLVWNLNNCLNNEILHRRLTIIKRTWITLSDQTIKCTPWETRKSENENKPNQKKEII